MNVFRYVQLGCQRVHLSFGQIGNRADVHAAVAVFGEETDAEIFNFVARPRHQQTMQLAVIIKRRHAQAAACIGKCQLFVGKFGFADVNGIGKRIESLGQVDTLRFHIGITLFQTAHVFLRAIDLVRFLTNRYFQQQNRQTGLSGKGGNHSRIDAAGYADDKTFGTRLLGVIFEPLNNMADDGLGLHRDKCSLQIKRMIA